MRATFNFPKIHIRKISTLLQYVTILCMNGFRWIKMVDRVPTVLRSYM